MGPPPAPSAGQPPPLRRLRERRLSLLRRDYLTHRALWPALAEALRQAGAQSAGPQQLVLDLGCGERPYRDLFGAARVIGLDIATEGASPDVLADATALPLAAACCDLVFSSQVIEHVRDPRRMVQECARVLKPGGHLVLSGPFWWPLHEEPHDYWRFTRHGMAELLRAAGLQPLAITPDTGALTLAAVACIEALPRWALALVPLINLVTPPLQALSANRLSTLNLVVLARRPGP